MPGLIKALCHHHCLRHGETELARGFLLQCGGCERRCRRFLDGTHCHIRHFEVFTRTCLQEFPCLGLGRETARQLCTDTVTPFVGKIGVHTIELLGLEILDFIFPLHYKPNCYGLHTPGR